VLDVISTSKLPGPNRRPAGRVCERGRSSVWPSIGAEDLIEPYETTCGPDVLPIEEATRLQDLYVVSFFKWRMLNESGYDQYLTTEFANTEPGVTISVR
jgi:hypothetical protein